MPLLSYDVPTVPVFRGTGPNPVRYELLGIILCGNDQEAKLGALPLAQPGELVLGVGVVGKGLRHLLARL